MFRAVIGSHKIYCYITLHPGRDFFSLLPIYSYTCIGSMMMPPRQARVFARLARWQLYHYDHIEQINNDNKIYVPADKTTNFNKMNSDDYRLF